ncbi:MAG: hypothetical protein A07HB70_01828, partial [uncultured archaeon A07HB70]
MADDAGEPGWYEGVDPDDVGRVREQIEDGTADEPRNWPALAVESGFATDEDDYYDRLHEATTATTRAAAREAGRADDQQLKHSIRAMDDADRLANELAERAAEWGESLFDDVPGGLDGARALADRDPA